MLSGYELAKLQRAIQLHFQSDYDAILYHYKTTMHRASYEKSRTYSRFERMAVRGWFLEDAKDYFVANALEEKFFILGMSEEPYDEYKKVKEALTYNVERDMRRLLGSAPSLEEAVYTVLPKAILTNKVHMLVGSTIFWQFGGPSKATSDDIVRWPGKRHQIEKLIPILSDKSDFMAYQKLIGSAIQKHYSSI